MWDYFGVVHSLTFIFSEGVTHTNILYTSGSYLMEGEGGGGGGVNPQTNNVFFIEKNI